MQASQAASLQVRVDTVGAEQAEQSLENIAQKGTKAETSVRKLSTAANQTGRSFGALSGKASAIGYQLQDVAVQAQMGTSAFVILGQQGSQLAAAFGGTGALIGAVIAIGSAIGGTLVASLMSAKDAFAELGEEVDGLVGKSTRAQIKLVDELIVKQKEAVSEFRKELEQGVETDFLADPVRAIDELGARRGRAVDNEIARAEALARGRSYVAQIESQVVKLKEKQPELTENLIQAEERLQRLQDKRAELEGKRKKEGELGYSETNLRDALKNDPMLARIAAKERGEKVIKELDAQSIRDQEKANQDRLRSEERLQAQIIAIRSGNTAATDPLQAERDRYAEQLSVIQKYEEMNLGNEVEYYNLREQAAKAHSQNMVEIAKTQEAQRIQVLTDGQQTTLSTTSQILGNIASLYAEGGKDSFQEWKNFASAQAAVSAALGAANALSIPPPPLGIALAGTIGALAAVQIAKIQSTEYRGRASGGQVRAGESYVVGERGREVITMGSMNGFVTSADKVGKGGGSINVTQVLQVQGQGSSAAAQIKSIAPQLIELTKQAVRQEIASRGSLARQIGAA